MPMGRPADMSHVSAWRPLTKPMHLEGVSSICGSESLPSPWSDVRCQKAPRSCHPMSGRVRVEFRILKFIHRIPGGCCIEKAGGPHNVLFRLH